MNNSDLPAMPISVSQGVNGDFLTTEDYGVGMGLTKREHFAAMAMQGIISSGNIETSIFKDDGQLVKGVAIGALSYADALLAELEK